MRRNKFAHSGLALLFGLGLGAPAVNAASHCKGMVEQACGTDSSCTWVQGYTRKDGRQVSSHCKLRRGKSSLSANSLDVSLDRSSSN